VTCASSWNCIPECLNNVFNCGFIRFWNKPRSIISYKAIFRPVRPSIISPTLFPSCLLYILNLLLFSSYSTSNMKTVNTFVSFRILFLRENLYKISHYVELFAEDLIPSRCCLNFFVYFALPAVSLASVLTFNFFAWSRWRYLSINWPMALLLQCSMQNYKSAS
jgi:hypothetical protein